MSGMDPANTFEDGGDSEVSNPPAQGPDEDEIQYENMYSLKITRWQRKYGGPPPQWDGPPPCCYCEVFCGRIPNFIPDKELIELFQSCGYIYELRLPIDTLTQAVKGFVFIVYSSKEEAANAVQFLDNFEIRPGRRLRVYINVLNTRLVVYNVPQNLTVEQIHGEFSKLTANLNQVIIYRPPNTGNENRGFCFLEYANQSHAAVAKKTLQSLKQVCGRHIVVNWANPRDENMELVKVLCIENVSPECHVDFLRAVFEIYGEVCWVEKLEDHAFIEFSERNDALSALEEMNGRSLKGSQLNVSLAVPEEISMVSPIAHEAPNNTEHGDFQNMVCVDYFGDQNQGFHPAPAQPVYQPLQPVYQPLQPVYQPFQPVYQPLQPVYQPFQPVYQPLQPVYQPLQPVYQPLQPVYQPLQPVYEPLQPVYQPLQPVYQPLQPVYQPPPP